MLLLLLHLLLWLQQVLTSLHDRCCDGYIANLEAARIAGESKREWLYLGALRGPPAHHCLARDKGPPAFRERENKKNAMLQLFPTCKFFRTKDFFRFFATSPATTGPPGPLGGLPVVLRGGPVASNWGCLLCMQLFWKTLGKESRH